MHRPSLMVSVALLLGAVAFAKEYPKIKIQVIDSRSSQREFTYTTPGRTGTSTTNCDSNGNGTVNTSTYGNNTYGNVSTNTQTNCSTTTIPSTPPQTHTNYIQQ